jgi:putative transcriptional regulator
MKEELFQELLASVREMKAIRAGKARASRAFSFNTPAEVAKVRDKLGVSQPMFARLLGISEKTLQNWEQGRRTPTGPAKVLLKVAARHPKLLLETVK